MRTKIMSAFFVILILNFGVLACYTENQDLKLISIGLVFFLAICCLVLMIEKFMAKSKQLLALKKYQAKYDQEAEKSGNLS